MRNRMVAVALAGLVWAGCSGGDAVEDSGGAAAGEADADSAAPVKIGLLIPTSGVYATVGEDMKRGFQLYLDKRGGMLGGRKVKVVIADEGGGPETGVPAAQRLVTRDKVAVVTGIVNSSVALGVRDLFDESAVPLILSNAGANDLTGEAGSSFLWRTSFANRDPNTALGEWLADQKAIPGGVFVLTSDYAAGKEHAGAFKAAFTAGGGRIAGEVYTPFGTTQDYQPFLSRIRQSEAGAVYAFYAGQEAVMFVRQYAEFGLKGEVPLYGSGFLTEGGVLKGQGAAAEGIRTALHYSSEIDTVLNRKFVSAYRAAFDASPTTYAVQSYDAAYVLDEIIGRLDGTVTGERLVYALGKVGVVDSPRGEWRFGKSRNPEQAFYLREVRDVKGTLANVVVEVLGPSERSAAGSSR